MKTAIGKATITELSEQAQAALKLLDRETADGIIGTRTGEYDTLIQGANAVMAMAWAVNKTHGLRQTPASLRAGAQTLGMMLALVHYAYALGMRRGRGDPG